MGDDGSLELIRRMALTHAEFHRSLTNAIGGMQRRIDGSRIELTDPPRRLLIHLGSERSRSLGSLVLPETEVRLRFEGFTPTEQTAFLDRFDLCFRRGGG